MNDLDLFFTYYFEKGLKVVSCLDYETNDILCLYRFDLKTDNNEVYRLTLSDKNKGNNLSGLIDYFSPFDPLKPVDINKMLNKIEELSHFKIKSISLTSYFDLEKIGLDEK